MKQFIKKIILFLIQLIEYFEYRNTNLDDKILNSIKLDNFKVETDTGFKEASHIHITKPFYIYDLYLTKPSEFINLQPFNENNPNWSEIGHRWELKFTIPLMNKPSLSAADTHILFDENMNQVFIKDLKQGDLVQTKNGLKKVLKVKRRKQKVSMFDMTINDDNHRFYTNDILSHNTIISSIYLAWYCVFNFDRNVMLLSNKLDTTKEIMDKIKVIFEGLPFFLKPGTIKNDVTNMKFDNGVKLHSQATTKRSGISFTIHLLYIDEFAHIQDNIINEFYTNVYPVISSSKISQVILTSTPNGFNLFHQLYTDAVNDDNEYTPYRVDWWQVPGRDAKWRDEQIAQLGSEEAFNIQYGNSFITADGRLLSPGHIERLEKVKKQFKLLEFEELLDLDVDYEKYLSFHPKFKFEDMEDRNNFFVFSIDIAEGGGGSSDSSVLNIFKLDVIDEKYFNELNSPSSFSDFFGLKQIGLFHSNELSIDDFAKLAYIIMFELFYSENIKVILEMNTYGNELIKAIQAVFPGNNDFDDEVIVKFKHSIDSKISKMGLKIKLDNKPIMAQKFKKYFHIGKIEIEEEKTIEEAISFGKDKNGKYKGLSGHDDLIMTCINVGEIFNTMDYADFVDELWETIDDDIKKKINDILEIADIDGDNNLQFDIYELIGGGSSYKGNEIDLF